VLAGVGEITEVDRGQGAVDVRVPNGVGLLPDALRRLDREGLMVTAAEIRRPGLDDVLFALTGDAAPGPEDGNGAPAKSKTRKFALHGRSRS
jgi:ABC-2 type transport system ATP-binding protein